MIYQNSTKQLIISKSDNEYYFWTAACFNLKGPQRSTNIIVGYSQIPIILQHLAKPEVDGGLMKQRIFALELLFVLSAHSTTNALSADKQVKLREKLHNVKQFALINNADYPAVNSLGSYVKLESIFSENYIESFNQLYKQITSTPTYIQNKAAIIKIRVQDQTGLVQMADYSENSELFQHSTLINYSGKTSEKTRLINHSSEDSEDTEGCCWGLFRRS